MTTRTSVLPPLPSPVVLGLMLAILLAGCAPAGAPTTQPGAALAPAKPTVLRVAREIEVPELPTRLGGYRGPTDDLINAFLVRRKEQEVVEPYMATQLPRQENGTWVVNADGTMRTIWTLRPDIRWHDGQPLTAHDIAFAYRVYVDRGVTTVLTNFPERLMNGVVARDDQTVEVSWSQPYFGAGEPSPDDLAPLPRHLMEDLYNRDKEAFADSSFWTTTEYVGLGPYRVTNRDLGVSLTLTANPDFFLGKPKIDTIQLTVAADPNAVVARLLSGDLDFAEHRLIDIEQALVLREQWKGTNEGRIFATHSEAVVVGFQRREVPNYQSALQDVRVRRALVHAVDREALATVGAAGLSTRADSGYPREHPLFPRVDAAVSKYPLDPRLTEQLMGEAGWTKGPDGMFRNAEGRFFDIELQSFNFWQTITTVIGDDWKRAGFNSRLHIMGEAERRDRLIRTQYTGAHMESKGPFAYEGLTSAEVPTEQRGWRGNNYPGWVDPEFESLFDRFTRAVASGERDELAIQMERLVTVDVVQARLYYQIRAAAARENVQGVRGYGGGTYMWNITEWTA